MEYHKYLSELEVSLDRYTHSVCRLLYRTNHHRKGKEKDRDALSERMEVDYNRALSQNHRLPVVRLICEPCFLCGRNEDEWCKQWCWSKSWSGKDIDDEDTEFVSKMKCRHNVENHLDGLLATHTITSQLVLGKSRTSIYFFHNGLLPLL